jgi:hypothetical protein
MKYIFGLVIGLFLSSISFAQSLSQVRDWGSHPSEENIEKLWKAFPSSSTEMKKTIVWAVGQHKRKEDYIKLYTILESVPNDQEEWLELTGEALAKTGEKDGIKPVWELYKKKNVTLWAGKWAFQWCMAGNGFDIEPLALEIFQNEKKIRRANSNSAVSSPYGALLRLTEVLKLFCGNLQRCCVRLRSCIKRKLIK